MRRVLVAVLTAAAVALTGGRAAAVLIYANVPVVGGTRLVSFDSSAPGTILSDVAITGGAGSNVIDALDFRPATGELYGLAGGGSGTFTIVRIDPATGVTTEVPLTGAALTPGFTGGVLGVDFNPVADALRIVSPSTANYRVTFATPTVDVNQDANLAYAAGDVNAGQSPLVVAAAYTNSFAGAASTTLYGVDANLGVLVTQAPPNDGTLNTVGSLGVTGLGPVLGFDITADNRAFLSDGTKLYSVDLTTGAATLVGDIGVQGGQFVGGIAVAPFAPAAVPEPAGLALIGVGAAGLVGARLRRRSPAAV